MREKEVKEWERKRLNSERERGQRVREKRGKRVREKEIKKGERKRLKSEGDRGEEKWSDEKWRVFLLKGWSR